MAAIYKLLKGKGLRLDEVSSLLVGQVDPSFKFDDMNQLGFTQVALKFQVSQLVGFNFAKKKLFCGVYGYK